MSQALPMRSLQYRCSNCGEKFKSREQHGQVWGSCVQEELERGLDRWRELSEVAVQ